MNKLHYNEINETLYHEVLDNGLNIFLLPKAGYQKTFVTFSTKLGSLSTKVTTKEETLDLPMGIAHFLEHKLFEQNNQDVSTIFARNQADVNAYTQYNRTTYLFSCTDNLLQNLDTLMNFVQNPQFTVEGIEKEVGIIKQEIKMYQDDPGSISYYGLIRNLFKNHPITNDILGTDETLLTINKDNLTKVHQYFYNPSNMIMFVTGNFDEETVIEHIKASTLLQQPHIINDIETYDNDLTVYKKETSVSLEVNIPTLLLGVKQAPTDPEKEDIMKKELIVSILTDIIFGKSSKFYKELLSNGLINESFGVDITFDKSFGFLLFGGETMKPLVLHERLKDMLLSLDDSDIDHKDFLRAKKQIVGEFIKSLNSLEFIASMFTKYYYYGASMFEILDVAKAITYEDVLDAKKYMKNEASYTTFTINPKKNDA